MRERILPCFLGLALGAATFAAEAFTTGLVPEDGVYKFTFGTDSAAEGFAVPASAVCDVNGSYTDMFSYGFLGTTDDSYKNDVPSNLKGVPHAIDGFKVVKGQKIVLHDGTDANGTAIVYGPAASEYLPAGASSFEGRYPIRFAARMPERGYYAVTCTVANASTTANADVTLFSERCHTHAQHLALEPGQTKTFAWSVELAPNYFKNQGTYTDNAINVVVVGENAALASVTVVKQPTTSENAKVRGSSVDSMNTGKTIWLCDDSTGTDQRCDTPYFALQNYAGVGSGLSRWAPADLSVRNQGEGGLNSSDSAHLATCLLKPGDYLYVQYGHNESNSTTFTNNLENYLTLADTSDANLVIVSPIERRYTWDSTNNKWSRTLQSYATSGKAWVEDKISNGATNVAFLDLNEYYSEWMNNELVRIHNVNSSVSLQDAIGFYYQCSKGGKVDSAHPNNAGADWGAYWVWKAAVDAVAAGADAEENTSSAKIQATVLAGITDGVAARLEADTPWLVSDEIVNAGKASNSYWDYAVKAGYDYINSAAVAAVDATVSEGVATISGVKMRVLNQLNYAKAVIDVVSADGTATNRWYSFYNYDASGNTSGDIVVPEEPGFLSADLDKDSATTSSAEYSATLSVPSGGKAYIHFAEASGNTWQVGDDAAISAVYPFEAWTSVLLDDDCSDTSTWTDLFGGVKTFASDDGHITFSMTGYDDAGTRKKAGGFAKAFADSATVSDGRIRVSFKALYTQGALKFALSSSAGTTTTPMDTGDVIATLDGSAAVCGASANVTLSADDTPVAQSTINSDEWMDVDMIIDLDAGKATASIGGADYKSYSLGTLSKTPWGYFGVTLASQAAHAGAIDDVKILALAPSPAYLIEAAANNAKYGSVEINGAAAASIEAIEGSDVTLAAVSADDTLYKFVRWKDANGDTVSTKKTLVLENIEAAAAYTAVFAAYDYSDDRTVTWDFSEYAASPVSATANTSESYDGLTIYLNNGDSVTSDGIYWANVTFNKDTSVGGATSRHAEWTAPADGTMTIVFQVGTVDTNKNMNPYLQIVSGDADMAAYTYYARQGEFSANTDQTLTFNVTAGTLYKIYSFYYNRNSAITIKSIDYTYTPTWRTVTAAAGTGGSATVSASEVVSGASATFTATPVSAAYTFTNWTDGEDNVVSTDASYTTVVTSDLALVANFAAREEEDNCTLSYGFEPYAAAPVTATGSTTVTYGIFSFVLANGDSIDANGVRWGARSSKNSTSPNSNTASQMKFTAPYDGTVSITWQAGATAATGGNGNPVNTTALIWNIDGATTNKIAEIAATVANADTVLECSVTAGKEYIFWTYYYNRDSTIALTSIAYTHASDPVTLTLAAGENGSVAINGVSGAGTYQVQKGEYVKLTAIPDAYYGLSSWTDGESNPLSTEETFWCYVADAMTVTAAFASEAEIDITRSADFSTFADDDGIVEQDAAWSQQVGRLEIHGAVGDTLTDKGIYWAGPKETSATATSASSNDRYVKFECVKSGTLTLTFKSDGKNGSNCGRMYVVKDTGNGVGSMYKTNSDTNGKNITATAQNTDTTGTFDVVAGETYYIWPYMYNQSTAQFWVSSISYAAAKSDYFALSVTDEFGDTSVTNVYYGDSVLLDAPATTETQIFTGWVDGNGASLGDGTHVRVNVTAATSATATYREADVHAFVWNWNVAEGAWNDPANWYYEGIIPATTYPSDAAADYATFNTSATVNIASGAAANEVWFNAPVTLTDGTLTAAKVAAYENDDGIVLQNAGFANLSGSGIEISCNLCIEGNCWVSQYNTSAQISGNLTGSGNLSLWNSSDNYRGAKLSGDNREFAGEVVFSGGNSRRYQKWADGNATSSDAFWTVETGWPSGISNDDGDMVGSSGTYWFGGYEGGIWRRNFGSGTYTLEIGALNTASTIDIRSTYGSPNVVKVGTANLTLESTTIYNLTINGGSVAMPVGIAPQTLTIAADTKIYLAGDAAWTAGMVTNLFSYTTLAGAGTLAEQVEVTGLAEGLVAKITVEDNTVTATIEAAEVAPTTDDETATVTPNEDGSYTIEVAAETVVLTVPDGVTVREVIVSPATKTVTGVPANATVKVAVSWADAESAEQSASYAIVKVSETGAVTLDEDAVVTVGEEAIPLKPTPSDAGDDVSPLEVGEGVAVGIKSIPGLVYRLSRGTTPDGIDTAAANAVAQETATSSRVSLRDPQLPSNAAFYRVTVDLK